MHIRQRNRNQKAEVERASEGGPGGEQSGSAQLLFDLFERCRYSQRAALKHNMPAVSLSRNHVKCRNRAGVTATEKQTIARHKNRVTLWRVPLSLSLSLSRLRRTFAHTLNSEASRSETERQRNTETNERERHLVEERDGRRDKETPPTCRSMPSSALMRGRRKLTFRAVRRGPWPSLCPHEGRSPARAPPARQKQCGFRK